MCMHPVHALDKVVQFAGGSGRKSYSVGVIEVVPLLRIATLSGASLRSE